MAQTTNINMSEDQAIEVINEMRDEMSPNFQSAVPMATRLNLPQIGDTLLSNAALKDEWTGALFNKVTLTLFNVVTFNNPLNIFKRSSSLGSIIEDVYTGLLEEHDYDPIVASEEVFKIEFPHIEADYHMINRQKFYKVSVSNEAMAKAFKDASNLSSFISSQVATLVTSNERDEYRYMKEMLENIYTQGKPKIVAVGSGPDKYQKLLTAMIENGDNMEFLQRWNAAGVDSSDSKDSIYFALTNKANAELNVDQLAAAYNLDKTEFAGKRVKIDKFNNQNILGITFSDRLPIVDEKLRQSGAILNPQGLYANHTLHVHQIISSSRFRNAVVYVEEYQSVEQEIIATLDKFPLPFTSTTQTFSTPVQVESDKVYNLTDVTASTTGDDLFSVLWDGSEVLITPISIDAKGKSATYTFNFNFEDTDANVYTVTREYVLSGSKFMKEQ